MSLPKHTRNIIGQIYGDRRVLSKSSTNKRGTRWLTECIYCHECKVMARDKLMDGVGTTCAQCTNIMAKVTTDEHEEILRMYANGTPVKKIAHDLSISLRTIYNHIEPNRRTYD